MDKQSLRDLYVAFNTRDIDGVLAMLAEDVDWPNAWEGGRLRGRDAVRDYWTRQWASIDPRVEPVAFSERDDGRIAIDIDQVVRNLAGEEVGRGEGRPRLHDQRRAGHAHGRRGGDITPGRGREHAARCSWDAGERATARVSVSADCRR